MSGPLRSASVSAAWGRRQLFRMRAAATSSASASNPMLSKAASAEAFRRFASTLASEAGEPSAPGPDIVNREGPRSLLA